MYILASYLISTSSLLNASHFLSSEKKNPAMINSTEITCTKEATFSDTSNMAEFFGQVIIKDEQFKLFCDRLVLTFGRDHRGIQHAEAMGNVIIIQENTTNSSRRIIRSIGHAGRAHYNPFTGNLLLTEWPQLQQGDNNHIAMDKRTRMILNKNGHSSTIGKSKAVIVEGLKE